MRADVIGSRSPPSTRRTAGARTSGASVGVPAQQFRVGAVPVAARREGESVRVVTTGGSDRLDRGRGLRGLRPGRPPRGVGVRDRGRPVRAPGPLPGRHGPPARRRSRRTARSSRSRGTAHGGGAAGNVGAGTLTGLRSTLPFVSSVQNLVPATGGVDAETVEEAKIRGPLSLRTGQRAVTAGDYERLTRETSVEVARARCLAGTETDDGAVRVLVVPQVRTDPGDPQDRRLRAVRAAAARRSARSSRNDGASASPSRWARRSTRA